MRLQIIPAENLVAAFQGAGARAQLLALAGSYVGSRVMLEALEAGTHGVVLQTEDPKEVGWPLLGSCLGCWPWHNSCLRVVVAYAGAVRGEWCCKSKTPRRWGGVRWSYKMPQHKI